VWISRSRRRGGRCSLVESILLRLVVVVVALMAAIGGECLLLRLL